MTFPQTSLTTRQDEGKEPLVLLLGEAEDRGSLPFGLALARGFGCRIAIRSLRSPGEDLPQRLRMARYGIVAHSDADRAISHLVQSASSGAHVPILGLPPEAEPAKAKFQHLLGSSSKRPLVLSRPVLGLPRWKTLSKTVEAYKGPVLVHCPGASSRHFTEVLAVTLGKASDLSPMGACARALGASYPMWTRRAKDHSALGKLLGDTRETTLLLLEGLSTQSPWTQLLEEQPLVRAPHDRALLVPAGKARIAVLEGLRQREED